MGITTGRFDAAAESRLEEVRNRTGLSVSDVLRLGPETNAASLDEVPESPYEVFRHLDLGPGGHPVAPARIAKEAVANVIREKHRQ